MSMELKGKVIQLLPLTTGEGKKGPWKKQDFIVETQSQYPKKVCMSAWGDKVDQFNLAVGDDVNVSIELESREYNGKWYTDARAWKLEKSGNSGSGSSSSSAPMAPPVGDEPYQSSANETDDLPF